MKMKLKDLKKGSLFTLKQITGEPNDNQILIKGSYDRESKTYSCYYYDDVNKERFYKASKIVYSI